MAAIITLVILLVILVLALCFKLAGGVLKLTGGVLKLALKIVFCIPCALVCAVFGILLCCTLILIPLGLICLKTAWNLVNPLRMCMG